MASTLNMFSEFVADLQKVGSNPEIDLADYGMDRLRPILGFDSAWYGWARLFSDRTVVHASSTMNLPDDYADYWTTIEKEDLVARKLREDRGSVGIYDRFQPRQTDGMIELSERYHLRKIACAMHNRPSRSTGFFASVYRTGQRDPDWESEDLQLLRCAVDHIFLAMRNSIVHREPLANGNQASLLVDPSGFTHLGLDTSERFLKQVWPKWKGERLPKALWPLLERPGTLTLKEEGVVVSSRRDASAGERSDMVRIDIRAMSRIDRLTPREREVARLLAAGSTHREAARILGSAPTTVRNQIQSIYEKLDISSRAELVDLMVRQSP